MFGIGDSVRIVGGKDVLTIVGIGPGTFYTVQLGNDGATRKSIEGDQLELVVKAAKPDTDSRFVPKRSIME